MAKELETVILTGFMCATKSTTGKALAELLGVPFHDTDEWLEKELLIDIPRMVETDMPAFRRLEAEALSTILDECEGVVSTGGGMVSVAVGRSALWMAEAPVTWLDVSFDVAAARSRADTGRRRPLFDDLDVARVLHSDRHQWYDATSDFRVDADQTTERIVADIVTAIS